MHVQLWAVGGARAHELATTNYLHGIMGLSSISVPNFTTFDNGVLWAAIDSHGSILIGKRTITMVVSQLRCLTPKLFSMEKSNSSFSLVKWQNSSRMNWLQRAADSFARLGGKSGPIWQHWRYNVIFPSSSGYHWQDLFCVNIWRLSLLPDVGPTDGTTYYVVAFHQSKRKHEKTVDLGPRDID